MLKKSDYIFLIKVLTIELLSTVAIMFLFSVILYFLESGYQFSPLFATISLGVGCFFASYYASKKIGKKGFLVGAVIVFLISYGTKSGPIYVPVKNAKGQNNETTEKEDKNAVSAKNIKNAGTSKNMMEANMSDLRFYSYNRIAITCLVVGIGCLIYGYVKDGFWFYVVGILSFVEAIVFFVLYNKKRNEFVEKEKQRKN